ncbi:MAG: thiamine pyrophosphate-dependent enzyme [Armatimonadetes bacterium]|nr:thiamine pyrophosphate-dependent enzyme [Armatimonadota bacterium]
MGSEAALIDGLPELRLLETMEASRQGDRREGILLRQGRGWFQVAGLGHEGMAALAFALTPADVLYPYYRDRALCLARGMSNLEIARSFYATASSSGAGRPMHGHYCSRERNIVSVATPTASQCVPAVGSAWVQKLGGSTDVTLCCVGEAAIRQGEYFEAWAFALQEMLPCIFVVQDNGYGISTPTARHNPYRIGALSMDRVVQVDGRDPRAVYRAGSDAVRRARAGGGPTVLWCEMDRLASHTSSDDHRVYRSPEELAAIVQRDPVASFAATLVHEGVLTEADVDRIREDMADEVEAAYVAAELEPRAPVAELTRHVYGPIPTASAPPLPSPADEAAGVTMVGAANAALRAALAENPRALVFGEDVGDPKGGVFGVTKGLSTEFPAQVFNAPLSEATIIGAAVGAAAAGWRPIFEIQFIDFIGTGLNQLINQVATLRWRTCGEWTCPMTLIAPCGAYLPAGGPWHSQTNEGFWAHLPGLRICCPSTPEDAAGLLWTAIHSDDPVLYLLPKHIFRKRCEVRRWEPSPMGRVACRRSGDDVTVVAWGNCVELALEAAERAHGEGVSVEVVDLRWISPCDYEGLAASVGKTGRLVVLQEDSRTGGFGDTLVAEMTSRAERWDLFAAPPQIVARLDAPVPFCPELEYGCLPDVDDVLHAIRATMG